MDNFYLGSQEYYIHFQKGTHHIKEVMPDCYEENRIIFTGSYENCLNERDKMEREYLEATIF